MICNLIFCLNYFFLSAFHTNNLQFSLTKMGANCSQAIMVITDGATEYPEKVFDRYNKNKDVSGQFKSQLEVQFFFNLELSKSLIQIVWFPKSLIQIVWCIF